MATTRNWETLKNQAAILGIAAIVISGIAMMTFPATLSPIARKTYRVELTVSVYDPLFPSPKSLLLAAIQRAKGPPAGARAFESSFDENAGILRVRAGGEDEAGAKAAARAALDAIVGAYSTLSERRDALAAYLAVRDYGSIRLLGRVANSTAAADVPVAATILNEVEIKASPYLLGGLLFAGLLALLGLLALFAPGKQEGRRIIAPPAPRPSAR